MVDRVTYRDHLCDCKQLLIPVVTGSGIVQLRRCVAAIVQVMRSMPRIEESRKRKAEAGPSYGKKSKTDPLVLSSLHCGSYLFFIC